MEICWWSSPSSGGNRLFQVSTMKKKEQADIFCICCWGLQQLSKYLVKENDHFSFINSDCRRSRQLATPATETVRNGLEKHSGKTAVQLVYLFVLHRPRLPHSVYALVHRSGFWKGDKIIHFHTCEILVLLCHDSSLSPGWTATGFGINIHGAQRRNPVEPGASQTFPPVPQLSQQMWFSRMQSPKLRLKFSRFGNMLLYVCEYSQWNSGMEKKLWCHCLL